MNHLRLNVSLLKRKVPNITIAARSIGLRAATVSNLCTGKIPIGRAEVNTLAALAKLADCKMDDLILSAGKGEVIETGIKVLDILAPITRGGTVGFVARPGMGQLVLLAEVFARLKKSGHGTILLKPLEKSPGLEDVIKQSDIVCSSTEEVLREVTKISETKDIMLAMDRSMILSGELFDIQEKLDKNLHYPVTIFLIDPRGEAVDVDEPYGPLDTLWLFDAELINRKMYPAINPVLSTSTVLEDNLFESKHMVVQQQIRKVLRKYRSIRSLGEAYGYEKLPAADMRQLERGKRLEAYLTQPFFVAEPFTKRKGESLVLDEMLDDFEFILNGGTDKEKVEDLYFIGKLKRGKK